MRSKTMQRRQLIGAAATAGSVTIAPALLTGCAAAPKSEPAATVATLPEGASAHVTAVAPTGAYRGCVLDGTGVRRWLGIPFIKNPYEPVRRYLKPEPYGAHEGVMDCLKHGSIPLQPNPDKNVEKKMVGGDGPLCLNIWAPKAGENLPVMVWVPGGGSISCAQNDERFDGTNFARDGVVLVTLAYRVNVDGFLKLRGGDSGNGNRDILEGLRWVKANIAAFGGDPDKITAFGQSAGGTHLVDVIASPYTKGLLAGAVIQSPSAVAQWRDAAQAEEAAKLVCDAIGCEPTREAMLKIPNESLAAFGSLAGRLAKTAAWARSTNGNIALFKAYVGDDFMPVRPVDAIAARRVRGSRRDHRFHPFRVETLHRSQRPHRQGERSCGEGALRQRRAFRRSARSLPPCRQGLDAGRRIRPDPERHHLPHAVRAAHGIPAQGRRDGLGLQL